NENVATPITTNVAWNSKRLIWPLANFGYRKISMNRKIAMLVAPSEYERFTFDAASSSPMESDSVQMTRHGLTAGERLLLGNHLGAVRHRVAAARMEATA